MTIHMYITCLVLITGLLNTIMAISYDKRPESKRPLLRKFLVFVFANILLTALVFIGLIGSVDFQQPAF